MLTAIIRNADDSVDKELDYSRYNLGIKDLWSTGNTAKEAGKQLTPGIDVSALMGGTAGQGLGSVFDIAGVTVGGKAPVQAGKTPTKAPSFADTNINRDGGVDSAATGGVSAPGADLGGFAGRSNIGNLGLGALAGFALGALGPIGQAVSVAATLAGVNKADMIAEALGLTDMVSEKGIMAAQDLETSAVAEAATAANSAEQAAAQDAETSAVAAAATAAAEAEAAAAESAAGISSADQDAAQSAETSAVADAATAAAEAAAAEAAASDSASEGGMSGMGDAGQGGGPDGPSGGNDAGDGSW